MRPVVHLVAALSALPLLFAAAGAARAQTQTQTQTQTPAPADSVPVAAAAEGGPLAPLAWLAGCWRGTVNQRDFREQWLPLRGGMMVGAGHTVTSGKTQDFEYLRLESRPDGEYYVTLPAGKVETVFKLTGQSKDQDDDIFTFANRGNGFPQTITYRRGTRGWLYAHVEGTINGAERKIIYPMRRIDCETGETIEK